jgi:hypothetical protein
MLLTARRNTMGMEKSRRINLTYQFYFSGINDKDEELETCQKIVGVELLHAIEKGYKTPEEFRSNTEHRWQVNANKTGIFQRRR